MRQILWCSAAVLVCFLAVTVESKSISKRSAHQDPYEHVDLEKYRDKKKVEVVFGAKNAIIGFVFDEKKKVKNPESQRAKRGYSVSSGFSWEKPRSTRKPKGPTTTEDYVTFEPNKPVSLDVPGELFGSSFNLVTNLSNTVGDFAVNSAIRTQRVLETMRPFLRFLFGAKGFVIEGPTDRPIFSDPNEVIEKKD